MGLREAKFARLKLTEYPEQLARRAELPKIVLSDQDFYGSGIEGRIHGHLVEQIRKTGVRFIPHPIQRLCDALPDVLDRCQRVGYGICAVVEKVIPVVLPKTTGNDADSEGALHLRFDLRNAILVAFFGIAGEKRCVVLLRMMRLQPRAVQRIKRHTDRVGIGRDDISINDEVVRRFSHFDIVYILLLYKFDLYDRCEGYRLAALHLAGSTERIVRLLMA